LVDADLAGAVLRQVDLRGARFAEADLRGVRLEGAMIDWRWAGFAVELLRRDVGCRGDPLRLVVELAVKRDEHPYAWLRPLFRCGPRIVD
jgi:hypothetical protein